MIVSSVRVLTSAQTAFTGAAPQVGDSVLVVGLTDANGQVLAQGIQILPAGSLVPVGEDEHEGNSKFEDGGQGSTPPTPEGEPGDGSGNTAGTRSAFHLEGNVQSVEGNVMVVDGRTVYLDLLHLTGPVPVGTRVEVNGYFTSDGRFIVTSFEIKQGESEGENQQNEDGNEKEQEHEQENHTNDDGHLETPEP
jgi:hypothetical protein